MEVFLPPLLLIISALQMVSFAFGPAIPWKKQVKQPAVVTHKVMMLDFKFTATRPPRIPLTDLFICFDAPFACLYPFRKARSCEPTEVKIDKAMIFWPEMIAVLSLIALFLFSAFAGLPAFADATCRSVQNSPAYRREMETGAGIWHLFLKCLGRPFQRPWRRFWGWMACLESSGCLWRPFKRRVKVGQDLHHLGLPADAAALDGLGGAHRAILRRGRSVRDPGGDSVDRRRLDLPPRDTETVRGLDRQPQRHHLLGLRA